MKPLHILLFGVILSACSSTIVPPPTSTAPTINTPRATTIPYTPTSSQSPTATPKNWPISTIPSCTTMDVMKSIPDDYQISGAMLSINSPSWSLSTMPEPKYEIGESRLLHFDLPTRIETDFVVLKNYQEEIN